MKFADACKMPEGPCPEHPEGDPPMADREAYAAWCDARQAHRKWAAEHRRYLVAKSVDDLLQKESENGPLDPADRIACVLGIEFLEGDKRDPFFNLLGMFGL